MTDFETGSISARFVGGLIDFGLTGVVYVLATAMLGGGFGELLAVVFQVANFIVLMKTSGQTIGMKVCKIQLVDSSGGRPTWGLVVARFFCMVLSAALVMIGFIVLLINKRSTLHDQLCETSVIRTI